MAPRDPPSQARCHAELTLRSACRILFASSPDVINAFTVLLGEGEYDATLAEWTELAGLLAEKYELGIEVSMVRDQLRIRVSRLEAAQRYRSHEFGA